MITSISSFQSLTNLGYLGMDLITGGVDITPFRQAIHPHVFTFQVIAVVSGLLMIAAYASIGALSAAVPKSC